MMTIQLTYVDNTDDKVDDKVDDYNLFWDDCPDKN